MSIRSRRWVAASSILVIAFLAVMFFFLLFSASGSQLVWSQVVRWVPGLQGEWVSGTLAEGWQLRDAKWQNDFISVSVKQITARWQLSSLLTDQIEVDSLVVNGLSVIRKEIPDEPEATPKTILQKNEPILEHPSVSRYLATPIPIALHQLQVSDFLYDDPVVQVRVKQLDTGATWLEHQINIFPSRSESADVWLKPSTANDKAAAENKRDEKPKSKSDDEELPEVFVPFDIQLAELALQHGRYHQQAFDTGLMDIRVQARFDGSALSVQKLQVQQDKRRAELSGTMTFIQNYLIDAAVTAQSAIPVFSPEVARSVSLNAKGDLAKLSFSAALEGKEKLVVTGKLQPLTTGVPFELSGDWLSLPVPETANGLVVGKGQLNFKGTWQRYQLAMKTEGKWRDLPSSRLTTELNGTQDGIELQRLQLGDGPNQLIVAGQLNWKKGFNWKGHTDIALPAVQRWLPDTSGEVAGSLKQEVYLQNDRWQGNISDIDLKGKWNGFPLTTHGSVQGDEQGNWHVQQLEINNGPNTLSVDGRLEKEWHLAGKLRLPKLSLINPKWDGSVDGDFRLNGPIKAPVMALRLAAPRIVMGNQLIRGLELTSHVTLDQTLPGQLQLVADRWNINGIRTQNISLLLRGNANNHMLTLQSDGKQLNSRLSLTGGIQKGIWKGSLQEGVIGGLAGEWRLQSPVALQWSGNTFNFKAHCWLSSPSRLCFENGSIAADQGMVPFMLVDLDTERLKPWLPDNFRWQSKLQAEGKLGWQRGKPDLYLSMRSQNGRLIAEQFETPYRDMQLQLDLTQKSAGMHFILASEMLGNINLDTQVVDPLKRQQLTGTVSVNNLQLYGIAPLVEVLHSTKGQIDINGRLAGTLSAPLFYGKINLKNGEVDTETEMVSLKQINGSVIVEGNKANLDASMLAGKGKVTLSGHSYWPEGKLSGVLQLNGRDVALAFAGYGNGRVDSDLQLQFDAEKIALEGEIRVPWARVDVKNLPENGVELSDDVHVVRPLQQQVVKAPFPFSMDLKLALGPDVRLNAMGLKTALTGGLYFRQKPGQAILTQGEIRLVDGRFKAYGQNLVIRSGKLMFNGDISTPYVMAEAIRDPTTMEDSSVTVGVKINAPINDISAQVFSEPELPDTDKLSYLLRGRSSTATTNGSTEEAMAAMMIGAGLGQTNGVVSDVASTFGLKDAAFDTSGSGTDTKVNLSAYLLKDLQLQYGVGVYSAVSEVKVRYFLLPQFYLQVVSSLSQAVDLFYKFEF